MSTARCSSFSQLQFLQCPHLFSRTKFLAEGRFVYLGRSVEALKSPSSVVINGASVVPMNLHPLINTRSRRCVPVQSGKGRCVFGELFLVEHKHEQKLDKHNESMVFAVDKYCPQKNTSACTNTTESGRAWSHLSLNESLDTSPDVPNPAGGKQVWCKPCLERS